MSNYDSIQHVQGISQFVDDIALPEGALSAAILTSPIAHGRIIKMDLSEAKKIQGVKGIFTSKDITDENQIGGIILDEELLAEDKVDFIGQPIAIVVAEDQLIAREAVKKINLEIEKLPAIFDPREAFLKGELIIPPRTFSMGDVEGAWQKCDVIVEDRVDSGGQEHLYLETQGALAYTVEGGGVKIISSTQAPTAVQKISARVLGLPMHKIEVEVARLGGGFGGKEDQATGYAVMTALAAHKLKKPIKLILSRQEDIRITGKRHPYTSDFKIGLSADGKILAYKVIFYQNAGAVADLSPAILERTLCHSTNSYFIPNVEATGISCRTNLPPNTAFRGFGGPQAMFVLESAIYRAAEKMGIDPSVIQEKNLLSEGDEFPFGQKVKNSNAKKCLAKATEKFNYEAIRKRVIDFNDSNKLYKKGVALMPVCFGISFTSTFLNQASALVHVYTDGSISVSTAAIEMGQGVNEKIRAIAATKFSVNIERVKINATNTTRNANTSPTAASSGADMNGKATEMACENILDRLFQVAREDLKLNDSVICKLVDEKIYADGKETNLTWEKLIQSAYIKRVSLSSHAHYATPSIYFDKTINKGKPFAYHVFGTAIIEATLDCLRGNYEINSVKVVHDVGKSINKVVDRGQVEGAIVQGLGWITMEELLYNPDGKLLTDSLSTYKVPDIFCAPKEIEVYFLEDTTNPFAVFNSKAIGEPPFMYGIGAYFAVTNAMKAFRKEKYFKFVSPLTNERVLLALHS
ncbi:MAG: molybdopterin-dependent oxidoreductase [Ignavibacteriales bacterium]|nr:molybdopterin-dependent oxidoreductase [Ignavibacteriales bacterium]